MPAAGSKRSAAIALQEGGNSTSATAKKRKMDGKPQKYYAVRSGRETGVFLTYAECKEQTDGYAKPVFKSFESREDAEAFVAGKTVKSIQGKSKFYAVAVGSPTGIFRDYADVQDCIAGVKGAKHKAFTTEAEAVQFIKEKGNKEAIAALGDKVNVTMEWKDDKKPAKKAEPDADGLLKIYTDGSSRGNGQLGARAGLGVFFGPSDPRNLSEPLAGTPQTNQRAELTAIQRALEIVPKNQDVQIVSDSQYSINCVTVWAASWQRKGWKTSAGEDVKNRDIVEKVVKLMKDRGGKTEFKWVKGHAADEGNQAADALAVKGAMMS